MRKRIFKIGVFVICIMLAAYLGIRVALFITSPFEALNTGNEIDEVEVTNGNVIINALIMGLDKDETRTDTLILASYNSENGKCFLMSIPRDTYVNINGRATLINEAYAKGGAELTINKVKELTNVPINYYVVFTFADFRNVIDALGGVEFNVRPEGYYYEDPYQDLLIDIPGGFQVLDGKQAEGLVRFRSDYARADLDRVKVQQQFVTALIEQKFNAKYLAKIPKIYGILKDSLKSNLALDDMIKYGDEILDSGITSIEAHTLPASEYNGKLLPIESEIDELLNQYFPNRE